MSIRREALYEDTICVQIGDEFIEELHALLGVPIDVGGRASFFMRENIVSVDCPPVWNYCDKFALEGHLFFLDLPLILDVIAVYGV